MLRLLSHIRNEVLSFSRIKTVNGYQWVEPKTYVFGVKTAMNHVEKLAVHSD